MLQHYSGLSSQQVDENRRKYGANVITPPVEKSFWQRIEQVGTYWMIRCLLIAEFVVLFSVLLLDLCTDDMSCAVGWILVVIAVIIVLVFLVALLSGHWNERKQRQEVNPLITVLIIVLICSGVISYHQYVFNGEVGIDTYLEPIGIALTILLLSGILCWVEHKNDKKVRASSKAHDDTLVKVIRDDKPLRVARRDVVVGDIIVLEAGDEVPANAELLEAHDLVVDETMLNGDSECMKSANIFELDVHAFFPSNQVLSGSIIVSGEAVARVFAVGNTIGCIRLDTPY